MSEDVTGGTVPEVGAEVSETEPAGQGVATSVEDEPATQTVKSGKKVKQEVEEVVAVATDADETVSAGTTVEEPTADTTVAETVIEERVVTVTTAGETVVEDIMVAETSTGELAVDEVVAIEDTAGDVTVSEVETIMNSRDYRVTR